MSKDMMHDAFMNIATKFFYWWHNQPGANTEEGFYTWLKTVAGEKAYKDATAPLITEISQLRHDLLNEQAASRMAHEVVARNRALEAENAQLRHALANAQVAAGFAKEMTEKVKVYREVLERIADAGCHSSEVDAAKRYGLTWRADVARRALDSQP